MECFINADPFIHTQKYITPVDFFSLIITNKSIYNQNKHKIVSFAKNTIYRKLREIFSDHTDTFLNKLKLNFGAISGSFITQSLMGTKWENSDIDIFMPGGKSSEQFSLVEDFLYENLRFKWKGGLNYGVDVNTDKLKISFVREYTKDNIKIQFVHVHYHDAKDFILNTFDFDICKNIYNIDNLHVHSFNDLIHRTTEFKYRYRLGSSIARCIKYQNRGFHFSNLKDLSYHTLAADSNVINGWQSDKLHDIEIIKLLEKVPKNVYDSIDDKPKYRSECLKHKCHNFNTCLYTNCVINLCGKTDAHFHMISKWKYAGNRADIIVLCD